MIWAEINVLKVDPNLFLIVCNEFQNMDFFQWFTNFMRNLHFTFLVFTLIPDVVDVPN